MSWRVMVNNACSIGAFRRFDTNDTIHAMPADRAHRRGSFRIPIPDPKQFAMSGRRAAGEPGRTIGYDASTEIRDAAPSAPARLVAGSRSDANDGASTSPIRALAWPSPNGEVGRTIAA